MFKKKEIQQSFKYDYLWVYKLLMTYFEEETHDAVSKLSLS
jgi:hypothetical protein